LKDKHQAYCKRSNTGGGNGLGMRLVMALSQQLFIETGKKVFTARNEGL